MDQVNNLAFKSLVIENKSFYTYRNIYNWSLPVAFLSILFYRYDPPEMLFLALLAIIVLVILLTYPFLRKTKQLSSKREISLDAERLQIKTKEGSLIEDIEMREMKNLEIVFVDKISLKNLFKTNKNFIKFDFEEREYHFYFEVESMYSFKQLDKIKKLWQDQDIAINLTS